MQVHAWLEDCWKVRLTAGRGPQAAVWRTCDADLDVAFVTPKFAPAVLDQHIPAAAAGATAGHEAATFSSSSGSSGSSSRQQNHLLVRP